MFNGVNCENLKLADDGNLLVIADTEPQLFLDCQIILNQLEVWCTKWRNGEKTSVIYLTCENVPNLTFFSKLRKITRSNKILVLTIDSHLNFYDHFQEMEGKVAKKMNVLKRYCGLNWGLKHATLMKLYKTLLLPQMLYAAPVWARKHLQALNKLQHKALNLILKTKTKFN